MELFSKDTVQRLRHASLHYPLILDLPLWASAIAAGFVAFIFSEIFQRCEDWVRGQYGSHPNFMWSWVPLCFLVSWLIVRFRGRAAAGSGIPQVMAAVEVGRNPIALEFLLGPWVLIAKILSSLAAMLGGAAIGREGPTVHVAGCIFFLCWSWVSRIFPEIDPTAWIVAGGAAGLAAAFNTPLGGIVYAIEELTPASLTRFKTSLIAAVIISGIAALFMSGPYLYLGIPHLAPFGLAALWWCLPIGVFVGCWGALFGLILRVLTLMTLSLKQVWKQALFVILLGLATCFLTRYVDVEGVGSGREVILDLLFRSPSTSTLRLALVRMVSPILAYLVGGSGGIFSPALAAGGTAGAFISEFFNAGHEKLFVLLGMIAFLTGVTRAPFTSFVLVFEMSDLHAAIFPMMVTALTASIVSKLIDPHSFYEHIRDRYVKKLAEAPVKPKTES